MASIADAEIDEEAERRLQGLMLGLKQQADQLMMTDKFEDAIRLYRGLLVHLTKSQVSMATQKDLVISCRMNVLGAMSKLEQWRDIPPECEHVFAFLQEIKSDLEKTMTEEQFGSMQAQILGRVFYFRGFALLRLGAFAQADHDFKVAMQMLPNVEAIRDDWKQVQGALMLEQKIQELMNTAMGHFQANNFDVAAETCKAALAEADKLGKHELTSLIHGNLAAAYARADKDAEAIKHYDAAIELTKKLDPSTWNERLFDLYEGLTGAHMRSNDVKKAYEVLKASTALLPKCKERQDREQQIFHNFGRVCFALEKYDEAEKHLTRVEKNAANVDERLAILSVLGKVYVEQKAHDKLKTVLDKAFPMAIKEKKDDMHVLFLLLWLPLLEERVSSNEALTSDEMVKLAEAYQFFGQKRLLNGLLRASLLMVVMWKDEPQFRSKRDEILKGLDMVQIEGLVGVDADLFAKLSMIRADVCTSQGDVPGAFSALKHALKTIKNDASTREMRDALLRRFVFLYVVQSGSVQDDDDIMSYLDESLRVLRGDKSDSNIAILCATLQRVSQSEMQKPHGDLARAEAMLEESIAMLKSYTGPDGEELLCQSLVGQCVLNIKRGDKTRAQELMEEIDSHPVTASWPQLEKVRSQLGPKEVKAPTAVPETAKPKPKKEVSETKPSVTKEAESKAKEEVPEAKADETTTTATAVAPMSPLAAWWDEYWFAVSVTIVGIIFAYVMMQQEEEEKQV